MFISPQWKKIWWCVNIQKNFGGEQSPTRIKSTAAEKKSSGAHGTGGDAGLRLMATRASID